MPELERQLGALQGDLKNYVGRTQDRLTEIQQQVDAIDMKTQGGRIGAADAKSFARILQENDQVGRLMADKKGRAVITLKGRDAELLERKTTVTIGSVGTMTSGVIPIERDRGIVPEARQALTVRDALSSRRTSATLIDFVKVSTPMATASPAPEASLKPENAIQFASLSERVRTIATWIPASRQILDDFAELTGFLETSLAYYVNLEEELQLLSGSGTGEDLHGLITQASPFTPSLLSAASGWNRIDIIGRAVEQLTVSKEIPPTFVVLHPQDWWNIRLSKDSFGRYILGDPQSSTRSSLFDLLVIPTTSIQPETFLVGSGNPTAAEIRDRMEMQVELSTEHYDYFTKNLVAIRAEKRLALVVKRPQSFISGVFATSPA